MTAILPIFRMPPSYWKLAYGNEPTLPRMKSSYQIQLAEQGRFELPLGYKPTDGFQDRSLQPLEYCSKFFNKKSQDESWEIYALNGGHYRARTCDLPHVKRMLSQLS